MEISILDILFSSNFFFFFFKNMFYLLKIAFCDCDLDTFIFFGMENEWKHNGNSLV